MNITNNTILVTGGATGIGLAFARAMSSLSNKVIVCGRRKDKLIALKEEVSSIDYFTCDIAVDEEQVELVSFLTRNYPNTNMLINNAGVQYNYQFDGIDSHTDKIEKEIHINFTAQVKLTDRMLPMLMSQKHASIVNVSSALAMVPKQSAPVYCATKAAMHVYSKALRFQLEKSEVDVFEIIPSLVDTDMTAGRGKNKMHPDTLVKETLKGMESGHLEIRIGKTKLLLLINRILPGLASRIVRYG